MSEQAIEQKLRDDWRNEGLARHLHSVSERRESNMTVVTPWETLSTWRQREWRRVARAAIQYVDGTGYMNGYTDAASGAGWLASVDPTALDGLPAGWEPLSVREARRLAEEARHE